MRFAALTAALLLSLVACSAVGSSSDAVAGEQAPAASTSASAATASVAGSEGNVVVLDSNTSDGEGTPAELALSPEEREQRRLVKSYRTHFSIKRSEQVKAAEAIFSKSKYELRYDMTKALLDELFKTMRKAQRELEAVDLAKLPPIPAKEAEVLENLLKIWENTAFFGDLILRLPDIVHLQFDTQEVRKSLMKWALDLCLKSPVYEEVHRRQLELVLQETKLAEHIDPNYVNPFREANLEEERRKQLQKKLQKEKEDAKRKKRDDIKKPRMAHSEF